MLAVTGFNFESSVDLELSRLLEQWESVTNQPQLSVLLVYLRSAALIHQTNHWRAKGDPFYGDHLMYERLYSTTQDHVDKVAEKAVGIGYDTGVDAVLQTKHIQRVVAKYCHTATYDEKELVKCSLAVENGLLMVINELVSMMNASGMSMGVDNLLAQIYDDHENLIYLLKRRLG